MRVGEEMAGAEIGCDGRCTYICCGIREDIGGHIEVVEGIEGGNGVRVVTNKGAGIRECVGGNEVSGLFRFILSALLILIIFITLSTTIY